MPLVNRDEVEPCELIDINRLEGLDRIELAGDSLRIGALVRLETVRMDARIRGHAPLLAAALAWVANPAVRRRGTLVGNAVASPPGAEAVAALVLQGAVLVLAGGQEETETEAALGALPPGRLATAIRLPVTAPGARGGFFEVQRRFGHFGLVGAGVMQDPDGRLSVVLSGLIETPLVAPNVADAVFRGALDDASLNAALDADLNGRAPRADIHASARYRLEVAPAVIRRALGRLRTGDEGPIHGSPMRAPLPATMSSHDHGHPRSTAVAPPADGVVDPSFVTLVFDGEPKTLAIEARTTLAERLDLRIGCGEGVCGACTVALDGVPVRACLILAAQAEGCRVDTVKSLAWLEGAAPGADGLTPLQGRLRERQAFQCGYCIPGLLVGTACFLRDRETVESSEVAAHLVGHICRCIASAGVAEAIADVLRERRGERP
jgi:CO/xanthine dehydrogenase FAD-binding subunit/aerobic-type carbon monoxide dehydrogenase small subunit (CoxS/CutS family)